MTDTIAQTTQSSCINVSHYRDCDHPTPTKVFCTITPTLQHWISDDGCWKEPESCVNDTIAQTTQSSCMNISHYRDCDHSTPTKVFCTITPTLQHWISNDGCWKEPESCVTDTNAQTTQSSCMNVSHYRDCDHSAPTKVFCTITPTLQHWNSNDGCWKEPESCVTDTIAQTTQSSCMNVSHYRDCDHSAPTKVFCTITPTLQHWNSNDGCWREPESCVTDTIAQTTQSSCMNVSHYRDCDHSAPTKVFCTITPTLQHWNSNDGCWKEPESCVNDTIAQTTQSSCMNVNHYRDCDHSTPTKVLCTITNRGSGIGPFSRESDTNAQTLQSCCRNVCPCLDCAHLASSVKYTSYNNYNRIYQHPIIARKAIMADNGDKVNQLINSGETPMSANRLVSDLRFTFDNIALKAPISAILRGNAHNNHFNSTTNITHKNLQSGLWGSCSGKMRWRLLIWKGPCEPSGTISRCCPTLPNPGAPQLQ